MERNSVDNNIYLACQGTLQKPKILQKPLASPSFSSAKNNENLGKLANASSNYMPQSNTEKGN